MGRDDRGAVRVGKSDAAPDVWDGPDIPTLRCSASLSLPMKGREKPKTEGTTPMAYAEILYVVADGVATVTLNRPERLNAWTGVMHREVKAAMRAAADDPAVRVIVLTGAGRGFCAGA